MTVKLIEGAGEELDLGISESSAAWLSSTDNSARDQALLCKIHIRLEWEEDSREEIRIEHEFVHCV